MPPCIRICSSSWYRFCFFPSHTQPPFEISFKKLVIICLCITVRAHRALPDVLALEKILTHPSLVTYLSRLPIRSPSQQKRAHIRTTALVKAMGKPCLTAAQAKCLDVLGLGFNDLLKLHSSKDEFLTATKDNGIRSRPVQEKIVKDLQQF